MIIKHCPWGRPGGGAPSEHIRRGNILVHGLFPESGTVIKKKIINITSTDTHRQIKYISFLQDCRKFTIPYYTKQLKTGGGGAPLRNASGKIITAFRDDPMISFSESTRNHVDNELRYKATPAAKMNYKLQLGKSSCLKPILHNFKL